MFTDHVHFFLPYHDEQYRLYWKCDCGERRDGMSDKDRLEWEVSQLMLLIEAAEHDVRGDMGDEAWDGGGWHDVSTSVIDVASFSSEAKDEVRRMLGIEASA